MRWPDNDEEEYGSTPEQQRYRVIEDEILERLLDELRPAVMEAFTRAASDVLRRERERSGHDRQ